MENEYLILSQIEKNEEIPQREIAKLTGLSLGTVNMLLKKMVKKGLVKIENLNKRKLRYVLTPHGVAEKSLLAYNFARHSYRIINTVIIAVRQVLDEEKKKKTVQEVILYGERDDFGEILTLALSAEGVNSTFLRSPSQLKSLSSNTLVFLWEKKRARELQQLGIEAVNILNYL